jgi:Arc/MetJ-type ribon-helix-helix transcriptional regulator
MADWVHIRVGREIKEEMQDLIEGRVFKNQGEIAREGIRKVLQKWLT